MGERGLWALPHDLPGESDEQLTDRARRHVEWGPGVARGAMPCVGLFTLEAFLAEVADLDITVGSA